MISLAVVLGEAIDSLFHNLQLPYYSTLHSLNISLSILLTILPYILFIILFLRLLIILL